MRWTLLTALLALACTKDPSDDSDADGSGCGGGGAKSVTIGQGSGSAFYALEAGEGVGLDIAPQGGFGVSVRAETTGLKADDLVDVNLITEIAGEQTGDFLNQGVQLYCQESGRGLLWGVVVGFDPDVFATNDDLLELNGEEVDLILEITDSRNVMATGRVTVKIETGASTGDTG